jgi:RNA polymerase sigma-70 factor, ECF subfamily
MVPQTAISSTGQLEELFQKHYARLTRVIGRVIRDQARAEEIAAEVFLKWRRNSKAHKEGAEGWLYRTALRDALDEWRRQARRDRLHQVFATLLQRPRNAEELHSADVERQNVRTVLAALDRRHSDILLLWSEDLSYREIAGALEMNANSVGSLLSRAQEAFRKQYLARYGEKSK